MRLAGRKEDVGLDTENAMNYPELVAACARTVGAQTESVRTLHDAVMCLVAHGPANRAIAAEVMVRFMAEFIESATKPDHKVH